jgi:hypothetical protein
MLGTNFSFYFKHKKARILLLAQLVEKLKVYAKQNESHQSQTADKW